MSKNSGEIEAAIKIKELERLLNEEKITLDQYLDTRAKIEHSSATKTSGQISPARQTTIRTEKPQPLNDKMTKKPYAKMMWGIILCSIVLVGGFFAWSYLNPVHAESLTVESYSVGLSEQGIVSFKLKNTGDTEIQISRVEMNGYLNRSTDGWNNGWNGTEFLQPDQIGTIYVYIPCYLYVLNASMPQLSSQPSQTEIENFYSWMESYNCTFTFVTNSQHQYDLTITGFPEKISWMESLTFTFTKTEELKIIGHSWVDANTINLTVTNTGQSDVTLTGAQVDDATAYWSTGATHNLLVKGGTTWVTIDKPSGDFLSGPKYNFAVLTAQGNKYSYQATKP